MLNSEDEQPAKKKTESAEVDIILNELEYDTPFVALADYVEIKHTSHGTGSLEENPEETTEFGEYSSTTQKLFANPEFEKEELARRKEENEQREKLYRQQQLEEARQRGIAKREHELEANQAEQDESEISTEQLHPGHLQIIENDKDFTVRLTISAALNVLAIIIMILQATFNTKYSYLFSIATYIAAVMGLVCFFIPYSDHKKHLPTPDQQDFFVALTIIPIVCIMWMISSILNQLFTTPFVGQLAAAIITIALTSMVHYDYLAENGISFNILYPTLKAIIYLILNILPSLSRVDLGTASIGILLALLPAGILFIMDLCIGKISRHG